MDAALTLPDYVILAIYLVATLGLGLWLGRKLKTGQDFFLAGKSLPWWAIGMSLVATDIGGTDIIGVGGTAFTHGFAVANFEWIGCIPAMIIAAFVFVPIFWRSGVFTIPEFMERRFNRGVRVALGICWVAFMACNLGIMLYASGKMMEVLFAWNTGMCIFVTAALVGVYTLAGGLAAVVYTDVIQCVVMVAGCLLVTFMGVKDLGGIGPTIEKVHAAAQARDAAAAVPGETAEDPTDLMLPVDTKTPFPWTGVMFGLAMVLGPAYWIGNQAIIQRALGARSEFEAKAAYLWGAMLKNIIPLIVAVPGLIALAKFPALVDGDHAFPSLVAELLPAGLRGIFLAAFIAALMSSADSYLNALAAMLTRDFYQGIFRPEATDESLLRIGRIVTGALIFWGIGFAFYVATLGTGIYAIFQTLMAFFQGPALAVLLAGLLWPRANGAGALSGFLVGIAVSILLFMLNQEPVYTALGWEPLFKIADPFLYLSAWSFATAAVVIVVVSLCTPRPGMEKLEGLVYRDLKPKA